MHVDLLRCGKKGGAMRKIDGERQKVPFRICCACCEVAHCHMRGMRGACRKGDVYTSAIFSCSRLVAFSISSFFVVTCSMDLLLEVETSIFSVAPINGSVLILMR